MNFLEFYKRIFDLDDKDGKPSIEVIENHFLCDEWLERHLNKNKKKKRELNTTKSGKRETTVVEF